MWGRVCISIIPSHQMRLHRRNNYFRDRPTTVCLRKGYQLEETLEVPIMLFIRSVFFILAINAFILCSTLVQGRNVIGLEDGGYTNVLIGIEKGVKEDENILNNLTAMFTDGSARLFSASREQVYWKQITILVPVTWTRKSEYGVARTEAFESSNILIHNDDPAKGHQPYVDNPFGCRQEGLFMHLTPPHILDKNYRESKYGPTEKVLVRNWGKLRWGLFDEHYEESLYDRGARPAYDDIGRTEGTRCSKEIHGGVFDSDGNPCRSDPNGATGYPRTCKFVPDAHGQSATESLLFGTEDTHVYSISEFCDNNQHNPQAPNLQNKFCGGKGAWEIMEQSADFRSGYRPSVSDTTPTFKVIQPPLERSVVLVLDISGSMDVSHQPQIQETSE